MQGDDGRALVRLDVPLAGAPVLVLGQRRRAEDVQDAGGDAQPRHLAEVGCLGAFVGDVGAAVPHPVVAQLEQPADLGVNVDVDQPVPHVGILAQRLPAPVVGLAVIEDAVNDPVAPDASAGAMLQLQVGSSNLPALVLAADEVPRRHAHVVEIDDVLDARTGAGLAGGRQQVHGEHADAGQVGRHHEPAQVLVAVALRVGAGDGPHIVGAVGAAHIDLLAVDDVIVAVAPGRGLGVGQVGAGLRLGEQLPGADFAPENLGQKFLLLLLRTPDQDGVATETAAGVVVRWQREVVAVDLFLQHHRVVNGQTAAAVFLRRRGPQPAFLAQPPAQIPAQLVLLVGQVNGVGGMLNAGGDILPQPLLHLGAKCFLLGGITGFKVHGTPHGRPRRGREIGMRNRPQLCPMGR